MVSVLRSVIAEYLPRPRMRAMPDTNFLTKVLRTAGTCWSSASTSSVPAGIASASKTARTGGARCRRSPLELSHALDKFSMSASFLSSFISFLIFSLRRSSRSFISVSASSLSFFHSSLKRLSRFRSFSAVLHSKVLCRHSNSTLWDSNKILWNSNKIFWDSIKERSPANSISSTSCVEKLSPESDIIQRRKNASVFTLGYSHDL
mmetsp:Transcript_33306/g.65867  ORF Transcript_33306/g.65867 Transcript_33306/m.65867 type:complete len:205 (+) Transcript_33306:514-1128(+)